MLRDYLIIRANVNHDRQTLMRLNSSQSGVQWEFTNGDAHPVGAEIPKAQDPLPISEHNNLKHAEYTQWSKTRRVKTCIVNTMTWNVHSKHNDLQIHNYIYKRPFYLYVCMYHN